MKKFLKKDYVILGIFILVLVLLRIPSLFEPHWNTLEGNIMSIVYQLETGAELYKDIWIHFPPGVFAAYRTISAIDGNTILLLKVVNLAISTLSIILVFKISKKLFTFQIGILSTLITTLLLGLPVLDPNIVTPETFSVFFVLLGLYLLLKNKGWTLFASGLSLGIGTLFSFLTIPLVIAVALFVAITSRQKFKRILLLTTGYIMPLALTSICLAANSLLQPFFDIIANYSFPNISSTPEEGLGFLIFPNTLLARSVIFLISAFLLRSLFRKKILNKEKLFLALWLVSGIYSSLLPQRTQLNLLLLIIPPISIVVAKIFSKKTKQNNSKADISNIIILILSLFFFLNLFSSGRSIKTPVDTLGYYQNFTKYLTGGIDTTSYVQFFGDATYQRYRFSSFLSQNYPESERAYVWTNDPWIYKLSELETPVRFLNSDNAAEYFGQVKSDLTSNMPDLIVIDKNANDPTQLMNYAEDNDFTRTDTFEQYDIYDKIQ